MSILSDGYYAVPDPADPGAMTYWRAKNSRVQAWPPRARYGPQFAREDAPPKDDRDAYIEYFDKCSAELRSWHWQLHAALLTDPHSARGRFAALRTRCCVCGRSLADAATKAAGIGPECRTGVPADVLDAIAAAVATAHAGAQP